MSSPSVSQPATNLKMPKMSDVLAEKLRTRILREHLEPETPMLSESELVETYRVSRATVREALRLLEAEGLISIRRGSRGGISVARPDMSALSRAIAVHMALNDTTVRNFMEFRKLLEPAAARSAAALKGTPAVEELIRHASEECGPTGASSFHRALGEITENGVFRIMLGALDAMLSLHVPYEQLTPDDVSLQRRAHIKIAASIAAGDGDGAAKAMLRHLEGLEKVLARGGRLDQPLVPRSTWGDPRGS